MVYLFIFLALMIGYVLGLLTMACMAMVHQETEQEKREIQKGVYDGGQIS